MYKKVGKRVQKSSKLNKEKTQKKPSKEVTSSQTKPKTSDEANISSKEKAPVPTSLSPLTTNIDKPNIKRDRELIVSGKTTTQNKRNKSPSPSKDSASSCTPEINSSLGILSSLCKVPSEVASVMSWAAVDYLDVQVVKTRADILLALDQKNLTPSICMEDTLLIGAPYKTNPQLKTNGNPKYLVSLFVKYIYI